MATVRAIVRAVKKSRANIYFRLTDGKEVSGNAYKIYYKSELLVDPKCWDEKNQGIKVQKFNTYTPDERAKLKKDIADLTDIIFKTYNSQPDKEVKTSVWLQNEVDKVLYPEKFIQAEDIPKTFFERFEQYKKDAPLSAGRKKHIGTTINKLTAFRPDTSFENIDSQYLTDFKNYLLGTCNLSSNTTICELRRLRAFYGWAIKKGWISILPFTSFEIGAESYGDPVYITVEERDILFNAVIEDEHLARVRDIFVFQCLVGCRVGDLLKMTRTNIINGNIEYIAGKTKDNKPRVARVPLTGKAKEILAKHDLSGDMLLPFISDVKYNKYLKDVFKLDSVKLTRMVTVPDPKTRKSVQKSIADLASSHMARRVFIGGLHKKGVKNEIIASMSGHVKDSKAFSRYYTIDEEDQKKAMKEIE
jgi:integrase